MTGNEARQLYLDFFAKHRHQTVRSSSLVPADDPTRRRPDISLARQRLKWQPTIPLREGLGKTIEWFRTIDLDHYRPPTPNY